jgi:hypothetical protein|tara:strand:- start:2969 stop:3097 length:129 start_codon:yes stop_codon:yes gene_type:complete
MIIRPTRYVEWEEFRTMDSEAKFWNNVDEGAMDFLNRLGVIA